MDTVMIKTTIINNLIHMKKSYILLLAVASFIGAVSCNVVALDDPQGESGVVMVLNGQVNGYDNAVTKASDDDSTSMWKDGDMLHFSFKNNSDVIPGTATYSSTKGWVISSLETSKPIILHLKRRCTSEETKPPPQPMSTQTFSVFKFKKSENKSTLFFALIFLNSEFE